MYRNTLVRLSLVAVVALLASWAHARTFSVIHTFTGTRDGGWPYAGVTIKDGNLYGTTFFGSLDPNNSGSGTVYQIRHVGSNWITEPVYLFKKYTTGDAGFPTSPVAFGPDGRLYGSTQYGGMYNDQGAVYTLVPSSQVCRTANCFWTESVLYSFNGVDGLFGSYGGLVFDQQGNIYGTTLDANFQQNLYQGNVYQLTPSGNSWNLNTLHFFAQSGADGTIPNGGVIFDKDGNLWGTTEAGGDSGQGTIYELTNVPGVGWQESIVHSFQGDSEGALPIGGLVADSSGNFYGTTLDGGVGHGGTVFELSPSGNIWAFQVIHIFTGMLQPNVCGPAGGLTIDAAGNLYGSTLCDGANQQGNVFKLTNTANGWVYTSLYDFTGGSDGAQPIGNVAIDSDGTLYGTASEAGSFAGYCADYYGCGTVWMIKP